MYTEKYLFHKKIYFLVLTAFLAGLGLLFLYHFLDYSFYGLRPACKFKEILCLYCPGCGGTRAIDALLHGRIFQSIMYHPVIVYIAGSFFCYFFSATYTFLLKRNGKLYYRYSNLFLWGLLIIIVTNFTLRNLLLFFFQIDFIGDF